MLSLPRAAHVPRVPVIATVIVVVAVDDARETSAADFATRFASSVSNRL